MDNERPPGGNLELGVVVQHVVPGMFQGGLEGVLWQHSIYIFHRKIGGAQYICCAVHCHDGWCKVTSGLERRLKELLNSRINRITYMCFRGRNERKPNKMTLPVMSYQITVPPLNKHKRQKPCIIMLLYCITNCIVRSKRKCGALAQQCWLLLRYVHSSHTVRLIMYPISNSNRGGRSFSKSTNNTEFVFPIFKFDLLNKHQCKYSKSRSAPSG